MNRYIARCIDRLIERDLSIFGAVLIQGPKWCGKTTTAQRFAASSLSLSDPAGGFAALQLALLALSLAVYAQLPLLALDFRHGIQNESSSQRKGGNKHERHG